MSQQVAAMHFGATCWQKSIATVKLITMHYNKRTHVHARATMCMSADSTVNRPSPFDFMIETAFLKFRFHCESVTHLADPH